MWGFSRGHHWAYWYKIQFKFSFMWIIKTVFADCIVFQLIICSLWVFISPPTVSVQFSRSVVSDSLWPHEPQHARPPCPSPSPKVYSNPCPLSLWWHPTMSSFVVPFSSCLQPFPASGSFQMSQFFTSGGQVLEFQLHHQSFQFSYLIVGFSLYPGLQFASARKLILSSYVGTFLSLLNWEDLLAMLVPFLFSPNLPCHLLKRSHLTQEELALFSLVWALLSTKNPGFYFDYVSYFQ